MWIIDRALTIIVKSENSTILKTDLCEKLGGSPDATNTVVARLRRKGRVITVRIENNGTQVICRTYANIHGIESVSRQQYEAKNGRIKQKEEQSRSMALDAHWVIPQHRLQA